MNVTMDEDEFEKYDKGITHSDNGLRDEYGKLSALPDITPISEDYLPRRTIIKRETVYVKEKEPTIGQSIKQAAKEGVKEAVYNTLMDIICNPQKCAALVYRGNLIFFDYIKPLFSSGKKEDKVYELKVDKVIEKEEVQNKEPRFEVLNEDNEKIVISGEQAELLIGEMRKRSKDLSEMIYLFSIIYIKDDKSDNEFKLEQEYLKQLVSDETIKTMKTLIENKEQFNPEAVTRFTDFLNGYIRHDKERIPINVESDDIEHRSGK